MTAAGSVISEESLLTGPRIAPLSPAFARALRCSAFTASGRHPVRGGARKRARLRPRHFQSLTRLRAWSLDPRRHLRTWILRARHRHLRAWIVRARHRHWRASVVGA